MEGRKKKSPRKRQKGLYGSIIQQMEFYFGDANLSRDRFLKQQVDQSEDGYVDLSMFLKFNKLRKLTDNIEVISKALKHSDLLQLSEDKTKVKRKSPFKPPRDTDDRTVYVECLPHKTNHEWISKLFSSCGKVTYVSLPKYKSTGDTKGFAFVEFEDAESARRACEELNNPPAEAGDKPGKFPKSNKQMQYYKERLEHTGTANEKETENTDDAVKLKTPETPEKLKKAKKRRRQTSESSVDGSIGASVSVDKRPSAQSTEERASDSSANEGSPKKKRKSQSRESQDGASAGKEVRDDVKSKQQTDSVKSDEETSSRKKQGRKSVDDGKSATKIEKKVDKKEKEGSSLDETKQSESSDSSMKDLPKEGKKRKHSDRQSLDTQTPAKQAKHETEEDKATGSKEEGKSSKKKEKKRRRKKNRKEKSVPELRVIPKKEWLDLKKEYLTLQKQSMRELKESLKHAKQNHPHENGQGEGQSHQMEVKTDVKEILVVEIPDVIVKIQNQEDMNRKQVKEDLPVGVDVAYIDVIEGSREGYIRFKDAASAKKVADSSIKTYTFTLLTGDDEKSYWGKLKSDREAKHNQKSKKSKKRGSQKLIDKAEKVNKENVSRVHIKFDEDAD